MEKQFYIVCGGQTGSCVLVGYAGTKPEVGQPYTLEQARMVLSWSMECGGLFGLAAKGPQTNTRITHAVTEVSDEVCRQVLTVSQEAREVFETWPNAY